MKYKNSIKIKCPCKLHLVPIIVNKNIGPYNFIYVAT